LDKSYKPRTLFWRDTWKWFL